MMLARFRPILAAVACTAALLLAATPGSPQSPASPGESPSDSESTPQPIEDPPTFRGSVTVRDAPIIEQSELDPLSSLVTTVSEQQIDDLYAQDLSSALRRVPGVVISRYNPIGAYGGCDGGAIFIRGHGSSRPGAEIATLTDGGAVIIPAKAANAGGVAVSGLEMSQNSMRIGWTRDEVDARLQGIMQEIFRTITAAAERYGSPNDFIAGANIAGFLKVANAMIDQGVV